MISTNSINKTLYCLITLLPLALITGPAIPDIIVSISCVMTLLVIIKDKRFEYFNNFFFKFFCIFYIYLIFSALLSDNIFMSLKSIFFYFRFGLFAIVIWYILNNYKSFKKAFFYSLLLAFIISIIHSFYQYYFEVTFLGIVPPDNRLLLLSSDEAVMGNFLSRLFPLLIGLAIIFFSEKKVYLFLLFLLFIGVDTVIYLSGERTALGLLFISSIFVLFLVSKFRIFRLFSIFFSILIIIIISFYNPEIKERNIDLTVKQTGIGQQGEFYLFTPMHDKMFRSAFIMFLDKPLIGVGPEGYRYFCNKEAYFIDGEEQCATHPHNTYIQILAETGVLGIIFIISMAFYFIKKTLIHLVSIFKKDRSLSDLNVCIIGCFLCTFWPFLPTLDFFNNWISIIYYLPVGFYLHINNNLNISDK